MLTLRIASAAVLCAMLLAQDQPTPTFKTNTNLVIVNVTVKDKNGKAIEDLKKDQFTLLEDGKPQPISVFEVEHLNWRNFARARSARANARRRARQPKPSPLPPNPRLR